MKLGLAGTGQVAHALGKAFLKAGHEILWVYGRDPKKAAALARKLKAKSFHNPSKATVESPDLILLAVKDDAIHQVAQLFKFIPSAIAHTSGSIAMKEIRKSNGNYGVFYPLQTFSENSKINISTMPICIEANSEEGFGQLLKLAHSISKSVYSIPSKQRQKLHLAAVFANNFTNHLFAISEEILNENHLSYDLLKPIILTAAKNLQHRSPSLSKTGPAIRNDQVTIQKHLDLLAMYPRWTKLYKLISEDINPLLKRKINKNKKAGT